jgi:sugar phosphate isomerase/epimerase
MDSLTRRTFLERLASLAAGGLLAGGLENAAALAPSEPHISFPSAPRDRIAVASYPFRAYIDSPANRDRDHNLPGMDLGEFASMVVAKFAVHNIEPHSRHFRSLDPTYLGSFREALRKTSVQVVDIPVSVEESFYDPDAAARNTAITTAKKWVDAAVEIGSPSIRPHIRGARGASNSNTPPNLQRTTDSLLKVTEYSAKKNVVLHLENDDLVSEDAFFLVKVIEAVNNPYLRALPDFANSALRGDAEFNYRALQAMFQHAYGICHIKDGETDDQGKQFSIDLKRAFGILKASGYRGYCSMEFDAPGDPYAPTAKLIEQTIRFLS